MNFIEHLKLVGGVKPCPHIEMATRGVGYTGLGPCPSCHGTGHVLDLAPLLAKPLFLESCTYDLISKFKKVAQINEIEEQERGTKFVIVGPQRAHSLVYEVARQLGGTAVVVIEEDADQQSVDWNKPRDKDYRLSLPIPPDATVLFVTDRMDSGRLEEFKSMVDLAEGGRAINILPYILCLVSTEFENKTIYKIISLHQEKS